MSHRYYNIPTIKLVTAPASEPVTLAELKAFLRIDTVFEDELINKVTSSARILVEEYTKRSLINQGWKISFNDFAPKNVRLLRGPVSTVSGVDIINDGEVSQVNENNYRLSTGNEYLQFNNFIASEQIEINYTAGYGIAGTSVPEPLKLAIMMLCGKIYERKNEAFRIDETIKSLIDPFRAYEL